MHIIRRVAVLGAGTMGARIAAHFANAGVPRSYWTSSFRVSPIVNAAALKGIENALKTAARWILSPTTRPRSSQPGNFEDHLQLLSECDWIVEAVVENLAAKRDLWRKVEKVRKPDAIVLHQYQRNSLAEISRRFSSKAFPYPLPGHSFFSIPSLPPSHGVDPRCRHRTRSARHGERFRRPPAGQRRGSDQGHTQLHRQPDPAVSSAAPSPK